MNREEEIEEAGKIYSKNCVALKFPAKRFNLKVSDIIAAHRNGAEWADANPKNVWHDADELPNFNKDGTEFSVTEFIVDSMHGHISSVAHTYTYEHWKNHIKFIGNSGYKWAYEKDLIREE